MKVQIAITGDYMENYGAHDWDGEGECPQYWKCKGCDPLPFMSNVAVEDIPMMSIYAHDAADAHSYSNEVARMCYFGTRLYPNKLSMHDYMYFDYRDYDSITSVSRAEIDAFLKLQKELYAQLAVDPFAPIVVTPEPLPYEEYDIV